MSVSVLDSFYPKKYQKVQLKLAYVLSLQIRKVAAVVGGRTVNNLSCTFGHFLTKKVSKSATEISFCPISTNSQGRSSFKVQLTFFFGCPKRKCRPK